MPAGAARAGVATGCAPVHHFNSRYSLFGILGLAGAAAFRLLLGMRGRVE